MTLSKSSTKSLKPSGLWSEVECLEIIVRRLLE